MIKLLKIILLIPAFIIEWIIRGYCWLITMDKDFIIKEAYSITLILLYPSPKDRKEWFEKDKNEDK